MTWCGVLLVLYLLSPAAGASVQNSAGRQRGQIWMVAIGHDWGAHEYIDMKGYIRGFSNEIVPLICAEAGMDCRIVWDNYSNCWNSQTAQRPRTGVGLMDRWYDACTGWVQTVERIHSLTFSLAYLNMKSTYFYTKMGRSFNPHNLAGKKIGFFDGWAASEQCIARAANIENNVLEKDKIFHIRGPTEGFEMLQSNQIDALLSDILAFTDDQKKKLTRVDFEVNCYLSGNGMMSRVDSGFPAAWNVGFHKARSNGKFLNLCNTATDSHGKVGTIDCVDSF